MKKNLRLGFTLVEMSIVLTIIGVLAGSVIFGKSVMQNSKLQQVMTDADSYTTAVVNFKQTYQMLPGDFNNAQSLWGADSNCGGGYGAGGGGSGTCNGNGDGMLQNLSGGSAETFLFWQHLALAGMFSQPTQDCAASSTSTTTCGTSANSYNSTIGFNVPVGSIRGSGWSAIWFGSVSSSSTNHCTASNCYDTDTNGDSYLSYGNVLVFGQGTSGDITYGAILTPTQAQSIDTKMDDGLPASGKVRGFINGTWNPSCTTGSSATATYNLTDTNPDCALIFVMGF